MLPSRTLQSSFHPCWASRSPRMSILESRIFCSPRMSILESRIFCSLLKCLSLRWHGHGLLTILIVKFTLHKAVWGESQSRFRSKSPSILLCGAPERSSRVLVLTNVCNIDIARIRWVMFGLLMTLRYLFSNWSYGKRRGDYKEAFCAIPFSSLEQTMRSCDHQSSAIQVIGVCKFNWNLVRIHLDVDFSFAKRRWPVF